MKKYIRWTAIFVAIPFVCFLILAFLLYIPAVQQWAVKQVASYAEEKSGMAIQVESVRLSFPLHLKIQGVEVVQNNDSIALQKDTLAYIGNAVADVKLLPLFVSRVEVDELSLHNVRLNSANIIHEARVKGSVGKLTVRSRSIDLKKNTLHIDNAEIDDAKISVELSDTVPPDTSKSEIFWKIYADQLKIDRSTATIHTAGDTMRVEANMQQLVAQNGFFDLYKSLYRVKRVDWKGGHLAYDLNFEPRTKGLDYNHIFLNDVFLGIDSFFFCQPKLNLRLRVCAFKERSGIAVTHIGGDIAMDERQIKLPNLVLRTTESNITADLRVDLNTFDETNPGKMNAVLHATLGKADLMRFLGDMPAEFRRQWANYPLSIDGVMRGNMKRIAIAGLTVKLPTAFKINASGFVENPIDNKKRTADIYVKAETYRMPFVTALLDKDLRRTIRIPSGITADANIKIRGEKYDAYANVREGGGTLRAKASLNAQKMAYSAHITAKSLAVNHFLPGMSLHPLTAEIKATGVGTDFMSTRTQLSANAKITSFKIGNYNLDRITATANIKNGTIYGALNSENPLLQGKISVNGQTDGKQLRAQLECGIEKIDLFNLHLVDQQIIASLQTNFSIESNAKDFYRLRGQANNITVTENTKVYNLGTLTANLHTSSDTTHAELTCGDFSLHMNTHGGYAYIYNKGVAMWKEMQHQIKTRHIEEARLRERLPIANIFLKSGKQNLFTRIARKYGIEVGDVFVDLNSSPANGINGNIAINSLLADSMQIDTIKLKISSDNNQIAYAAQVRNNKKNPQYVFNALLNGAIEERGAHITTQIYDANNKLGIGIGLRATIEDRGLRISVMNKSAVLGYKSFAVADSNYVFLANDRRVRADVKLKATDGTGIQLLTNNENTDALQDITLSLNRFNLEKLFAVLPYMPNISGTLNGDFHVIQTKDQIALSSAISVTNMAYQQSQMGDISTEFVYMPKQDGGHYIDGMLMQNSNEVGRISGEYNASRGEINATLSMERLPLSLVNGFIPRKLIGFKGYAEGEVAIKGTVAKPLVNGEVYLDSTYIISEPYGVQLRCANDPVRIVNSNLLFENFEVYAFNNSPLNVAGACNFEDPQNVTMDVRMKATNYEIINAKENYRSEVFGKVLVNFFGRMNGEITALQMRGKLDVLDATDMTYVLKDSPLSTDNQLEDLVAFTDFHEDKQETINRPPLTGFSMDLGININHNAHILCALNADKSNYIDLMGGGELRMRYNAIDNLRLTGRYTLSNGEMKYSLPVIPLKTFSIKDGSYIEFTGNPMNPKLNITATETTKASVSTNGKDSRIVDFECGVVVTKTLKNMGLQFTIDAPQDMTLSNQLNTMGIEERGKLAVTMLTTGMYLADGNTNAFSMNNALSAFLQSQINNITGNALRTLDLSFGLDNVTDASGNMHTDYSFKFSKRLWNNRLRIIVGGKVSSGNDIPAQSTPFFNNVSLEYRLNQGSTVYTQAFYNRDSYDWLEGDIGKYGIGFIWRRKLRHFKDIFRFKTPEDVIIMPQPKDSINKR